jgi:hypothetical protein
VIVGIPTTTKSVALVTVLMVFVTLILPVVAPVGTIAVIDVAEFTVTEVAVAVLNLTVVVPQNFVPVIVTLVPTVPAVGVNEVIVGAAGAVSTVKSAVLAVSAAGVSTVILPVVAPVGTAAVTVVSVRPVSVVWLVPLKSTAVAPVNPVPVIATDVPITPHLGVKFVTVEADAGTAVSPTINVTPTTETTTRTNAGFPKCRPNGFMASTSLSPLLEMKGGASSPPNPIFSIVPGSQDFAAGFVFPDEASLTASHDDPRSYPTDVTWAQHVAKDGKSSGLYTSPFHESKNSGAHLVSRDPCSPASR